MLPTNWKPCQVNHAPNLSQYEINADCYEKMHNRFWDLNTTEEEEEQILLHLSLYKGIPQIIGSMTKIRYTAHNWKSFI